MSSYFDHYKNVFFEVYNYNEQWYLKVKDEYPNGNMIHGALTGVGTRLNGLSIILNHLDDALDYDYGRHGFEIYENHLDPDQPFTMRVYSNGVEFIAGSNVVQYVDLFALAQDVCRG